MSRPFHIPASIGAASLALQLFAAAAWAAESQPFAAPRATELPTTGAGSLLQVTIALGIVLAAVFAAAWLMQRVKSLSAGRSGSIRVITSVALGAKERAVVVQLGHQQLLLGVAPGRVTTLHVLAQPLDSQETSNLVAGADSTAEAPSFKALLRKGLGLS